MKTSKKASIEAPPALPKGAVVKISPETAQAIAEEVDFDEGVDAHSFDDAFESQDEDFDDEGLI